MWYKPKLILNSGIGGHSPQYLVNKAAGMLSRKELKSWGGNFLPLFQGIPKFYCNNDIIGSSELERSYGIKIPLDGFPLFEVALWAESNLSFEDYSRRMGKLIHSFSKVARNHENAWIKKLKTVNSVVLPCTVFIAKKC